MNNETAFSNLLLDDNFQNLNRIRKKKTIFDILGVDDKEVPFTRLLSWLLDPYADHQMGSFPIKSFLRQSLRREKKNKDVITALQLEELNFADVGVKSEYQIDIEIEGDKGIPKKKQGRLDVYAEISALNGHEKKYPLLLIEAKIDATQHNGQTHLYQQWIKKLNKEGAPFHLCLYI